MPRCLFNSYKSYVASVGAVEKMHCSLFRMLDPGDATGAQRAPNISR